MRDWSSIKGKGGYKMGWGGGSKVLPLQKGGGGGGNRFSHVESGGGAQLVLG